MTALHAGAERRAFARADLIKIVLLVAVTTMIDAHVSAVVAEKQTFLFKEVMHLSAGDVATFNLLLGIPIFLQPAMGAGIDVFSFLGGYRRGYFVVSALIASASYFAMAGLHFYPYLRVLLLLMASAAGYTLMWIVINAVMVAVGNRTGTFGRLQSIAMFLPLALNIIFLSHFGGYVTEHWSYPHAFQCAGLLYLLYLPCVALMEDRRAVRVRAAGEADRELAKREGQRRATLLRSSLRSPGMWAVVAFVFYLEVTPYINTAKTFYQADVLHFSKQTIGDMGRYLSAGLMAAILFYNLVSHRLSARAHVYGAYLGGAGIYLAYMIMHDQPSAMLAAALAGFFINYSYICIYALGARICPPGSEGVIYGLILMSISSSYLISEKFGSSIYDYFGPLNRAHHYSTAHGCYAALWFGFGFILLGGLLIPFLPRWARSASPLQSLPLELPSEGPQAAGT